MIRTIKPTSTWVCETCKEPDVVMDSAAMREHLRDVHHINPIRTPFNRTTLTHMKSEGFTQSTYAVDVGGVRLLNATVNPCGKYDEMRAV